MTNPNIFSDAGATAVSEVSDVSGSLLSASLMYGQGKGFSYLQSESTVITGEESETTDFTDFTDRPVIPVPQNARALMLSNIK